MKLKAAIVLAVVIMGPLATGGEVTGKPRSSESTSKESLRITVTFADASMSFVVEASEAKPTLHYAASTGVKKAVKLSADDLSYLRERTEKIKELVDDKGPCPRTNVKFESKLSGSVEKVACLNSGSPLAKSLKSLVELLMAIL